MPAPGRIEAVGVGVRAAGRVDVVAGGEDRARRSRRAGRPSPRPRPTRSRRCLRRRPGSRRTSADPLGAADRSARRSRRRSRMASPAWSGSATAGDGVDSIVPPLAPADPVAPGARPGWMIAVSPRRTPRAATNTTAPSRTWRTADDDIEAERTADRVPSSTRPDPIEGAPRPHGHHHRRRRRDMSGDHGAAWSAGLRLGTDAELQGWLEVAQAACDEADAIARRHFRRDLHIETKPDRTFVTEADTAIEARIRERIHAAFPDHGMVGEEYGVDDGDASVRWYIDPIDGTHNFMRGVPLFGTLLAVERDGELQASVISAPAFDERWWAHRGGGAWARHGTRRGARPDRRQRGDRARVRPDPLWQPTGSRAVGPGAGPRGAPRRRLARARVRRLLGLHAPRRGRGGGDGRGRAQDAGTPPRRR